jgi:hypothetical protein
MKEEDFQEEINEKLKHRKYDLDKEVKLLYHCDYYDGMLSGVCLIENKKYWFSIFDEYQRTAEEYKDEYFEMLWYRRFSLHDLDEKTWKEEDERHSFFIEKVGGHCQYIYDETNSLQGRVNDDLRNPEEMKEFYKRYPSSGAHTKEENHREFPVIGWFEM